MATSRSKDFYLLSSRLPLGTSQEFMGFSVNIKTKVELTIMHAYLSTNNQEKMYNAYFGQSL